MEKSILVYFQGKMNQELSIRCWDVAISGRTFKARYCKHSMELSKVLDCSTYHSFKEMLRVIKYVLDTKDFGLKIVPKFEENEVWELTCYTDSDYSVDP